MFNLSNLYIAWRNSSSGGYRYLASSNAAELVELLTSVVNNTDISAVLQKKSYLGSRATKIVSSCVYQTSHAVLTTKPRQAVQISNYLYYYSIPPTLLSPDLVYLHVKLAHPPNVTKFEAEISRIPKDERVMFTCVCHPLIWLTLEPIFAIVCCSPKQFVEFAVAYLNGTLVTAEKLDIEHIAIVNLLGNPKELIAPNPYTDPIRREAFNEEDERVRQAMNRANERRLGNIAEEEFKKAARKPDDLVDTEDEDKDRRGSSKQHSGPPNIYIYTGKNDPSAAFTNLQGMVRSCVGTDSYTIYHLKHDELLHSPWQDNCRLLISAAEQISDQSIHKAVNLLFFSGGRILSVCSDLDKEYCDRKLNENQKALVEQVVQTKYGECTVNLVQGRFHYTDLEDRKKRFPDVEISALASNAMDQLVIAEAKNVLHGKCIVCQVKVGWPAERCAAVPKDVVPALRDTEEQHKKVFHDILCRLDVSTDKDYIATSKEISTCYVYGRQELRCKFVKEISKTHASKLNDEFLGMPRVGDIDLRDCDTSTRSFDLEKYTASLTSKVLGNIVLYQRVTKTTQNLVDPFIFCSPGDCGVVAIARRQISGLGRGNNAWLSPQGSLAMSVHVRMDVKSHLGQAPALIQTIPAVAVARIIQSLLPDLQEEEPFKVSVKWPNDMYYGKAKIGGIIVKSTIMQSSMHAIVGVGVNISNEYPTVNVNQIIRDYNTAKSEQVPCVDLETMAARICSESEILIDALNRDKEEYMAIYYKHWMHGGCRVDVPAEGVTKALITGLDSHGYLSLKKDDGTVFSVMPDGNSFDILHNLIKIK